MSEICKECGGAIEDGMEDERSLCWQCQDARVVKEDIMKCGDAVRAVNRLAKEAEIASNGKGEHGGISYAYAFGHFQTAMKTLIREIYYGGYNDWQEEVITNSLAEQQ